jgi:hypothetical protein
VFQCASDSKVSLTAVQPWERITDAVVLGKIHLVGGGEGLVVVIILAVAKVGAVGGRATPALIALEPEQAGVGESLLLSLLGDGDRERGDLVYQRNQWVHHVFNGLDSGGHLRHGEFPIVNPQAGGGICR